MKKIKWSRHPPVTDYTSYTFTLKETVIYILINAIFAAVVAWLFYDSVIAWIMLLPITVLKLKKKSKELCCKRKQRLELEFREVILSVSANIQAGYSIENAFSEAYKDIVILYGNDCIMASELRRLLRKLNNNEQLETILMDLAVRSGVRDIRDFADIFQIAKRGGGNMREIISNTAEIIGEKQGVRREILTVVSEKKFEQNIMRYIPFFIIFYISLTTPGYFENLYHNIFGWLVMSGALLVYETACFMSDKILDIDM